MTGTSNLAEKSGFTKSRIKGLKKSAAMNIAWQLYAKNKDLKTYEMDPEIEEDDEFQSLYMGALENADFDYNYSYYKK